jgi:ABC-type amino acid transport system permease subunit
MELAASLWGWTPFLAGGFAGNLLISALAMLAGSALGTVLGRARDASVWVRAPATACTSLCRNVPSFVLMFYVALVLPVEIEWRGAVIAVPLLLKAALALTLPVVGFASDQYLALRRQRRERLAGADATYVVAWLQYFLIILMASSTASVIGADEIVGRANRVIATDSRPAFLIATYVYVSGWFLASGLMTSAAAAVLVRARRGRRGEPRALGEA